MKSPDVNIDICLALLRELLSGFRGYPPTEIGERRFASALQESCLTVGHVRATLQAFEEGFPTVRQIHDAAFNLRPKFDTRPDQRKEWLRSYGVPAAFDKHPADEIALHWQVFRDMLYYTEGPGGEDTYWAAARARILDPNSGHADSVAFVRHQIATHGWPAVMGMAGPPEPMPYSCPKTRRTRAPLASVGAPVTQADIDRAVQKRKTPEQVDRELDSWDDPDR